MDCRGCENPEGKGCGQGGEVELEGDLVRGPAGEDQHGSLETPTAPEGAYERRQQIKVGSQAHQALGGGDLQGLGMRLVDAQAEIRGLEAGVDQAEVVGAEAQHGSGGDEVEGVAPDCGSWRPGAGGE